MASLCDQTQCCESLFRLLLEYPSPEWENYFELSQNLYSASKLKQLSLRNCDIKPASSTEVINWTLLKSLTISSVILHQGAIENILSACPALESLEMSEIMEHNLSHLTINSTSLINLEIFQSYSNDGDELVVVEIVAPHLQSLVFSLSVDSFKYRLVNVSSLVTATPEWFLQLDGDSHYYDDCCDMLREVLLSLQHVKKLNLDCFCIQVLSAIEAKSLPPLLLGSKRMKLCTGVGKVDILGIARLLRSSADLETLEIEIYPSHVEVASASSTVESLDFSEESFWTSQRWMPNCVFLHLKTVKIVHFHKLIKEKRKEQLGFTLGLIKFLLSHAKMLEMLVIEGKRFMKKCSPLGDSQGFTLESKGTGKVSYAAGWEMSPDFSEIAQNLINFPRSSQHAVIIFHQ